MIFLRMTLISNVIFFALAALFAVLATGLLYSPGPVVILLGIAFGLSGVVLVILTTRLEETRIRKLFFIVTGASAAAIPLAAILHNFIAAIPQNFIFEAFSFVLAAFVFPAIFVIGWLGSLLLMRTTERPISTRRDLMIGLVSVLVVAALAIATVISWGG